MVSKDIPQIAHAAADNSTGFHLVDVLVSVEIEFDFGNNPVQHLLQGVCHVVGHDAVYHQLPETKTVVAVVDSFVVVDCIAADADPVVGIADVVDVVVVVDGSAAHRRVFSGEAERSDSSTPWRRWIW